MLKFLKGVVAGSGAGLKDFPYNIGEPYSSSWGSWTHYRGTSKDDASPVSIFSLSGNSSQDGHLLAGRNGVKRLRTIDARNTTFGCFYLSESLNNDMEYIFQSPKTDREGAFSDLDHTLLEPVDSYSRWCLASFLEMF